MQNSELFISKSIDLHLYFMRITEEHLIFIQLSLPPKNAILKQEAEKLRQELLKIFSYIISISSGYVSKSVINSQELITKYTYEIEKLTEFYTGININRNYTVNENNMLVSGNPTYKQITNEEIKNLNNYIKEAIKNVVNFLTNIRDSVLKCELFTIIFPERLGHIIEEGTHYIVEIEKLQNMNLLPTLESLNEEMIFWNENLGDHGLYTSLQLDPTEKELASIARNFSENFEELEEEAKNARNNPTSIINVINKSLEETMKYKVSNTEEVEKILRCGVKSIILPLVVDHDLRELNHYLRMLYEGKKYLNI